MRYKVNQGKLDDEGWSLASEVEQRLLESFGPALRIFGPGSSELDGSSARTIPRLPGVLLPAFVKAHGHDHEQPIIGVAKDQPLTSWLDHVVNPFTAS